MVQRVFLQEVGFDRDTGEARYHRGDVRDWPLQTWKGFTDWDEITAPIDDVVAAGVHEVPSSVVLPDGTEREVTHQRVDLDQPKRRGPGRPRKDRSA